MQRVEVKMIQDQSAYAKQADVNDNIGLVVGSRDEQEQTQNTKIMSINQNHKCFLMLFTKKMLGH